MVQTTMIVVRIILMIMIRIFIGNKVGDKSCDTWQRYKQTNKDGSEKYTKQFSVGFHLDY